MDMDLSGGAPSEANVGPSVWVSANSPPVAQDGDTYVAEDNETPRAIAKRLGIDLDSFVAVNQVHIYTAVATY